MLINTYTNNVKQNISARPSQQPQFTGTANLCFNGTDFVDTISIKAIKNPKEFASYLLNKYKAENWKQPIFNKLGGKKEQKRYIKIPQVGTVKLTLTTLTKKHTQINNPPGPFMTYYSVGEKLGARLSIPKMGCSYFTTKTDNPVFKLACKVIGERQIKNLQAICDEQKIKNDWEKMSKTSYN